MAKKLMVIAGEASGDLHASKVICALKRLNPEIEVFGVGGEKMKRCGVELIYDISEIAVIGFVDVFKGYVKFIELKNLCESALVERKPNGVLLVDYPGFNLRFARFAKKNGVKVFYYIAPQVWAWGRGRIKVLKKLVDKLFVIFKFEESFFKSYGVEAEFVGHPLLEDIAKVENLDVDFLLSKYGIEPNKEVISFFPGSRIGEIRLMFKTMLKVGKILREKFGVEVVFSRAKTISEDEFFKIGGEDVKFFKFVDDPHALLKMSKVAVVKSGTTSLEAGILGIPMVVCYKTSALNYFIGKLLVKKDVIESIALPNIVLGKRVVPELIQNDFTVQRVFELVKRYLEDEKFFNDVRDELLKIKEILKFDFGYKTTSEIVAEKILSML
jgi:lipid-A-disaccharide synthase